MLCSTIVYGRFSILNLSRCLPEDGFVGFFFPLSTGMVSGVRIRSLKV